MDNFSLEKEGDLAKATTAKTKKTDKNYKWTNIKRYFDVIKTSQFILTKNLLLIMLLVIAAGFTLDADAVHSQIMV